MDNITTTKKIIRDIRDCILQPTEGGYFLDEEGLSRIKEFINQSWQAGWDFRNVSGKNNNCERQVTVYHGDTRKVCQSLGHACKLFSVPKSTALSAIKANRATKSGYRFVYDDQAARYRINLLSHSQ